MSDLGEKAAKLKWHDGLSWNEVAEALGVKRERARSAARIYKQNHPEDFNKEGVPADIWDEMPDGFPHYGDGVHVEDHPNERIIHALHPQIRTVEQLVEYCEVDEDVWAVTNPQIRTWPLHAKREVKHLRYEGGRIVEGTIDKSGMYRAQNVYIRITLKRREPEPIHPILRPIEMPALIFRVPERPSGDSCVRTIAFGDSQIGFRHDLRTGKLDPFHDRGALDVVAQVAVAAGVDRIDVLGDYMDWTQATLKYMQEPEFFGTTQPALHEGNWWLWQLRELTGADTYLYEGNHCVRLVEALIKLMPWAYEMTPADDVEWPVLSVPRLLGLPMLGVNWVGDYPKGESWLGDRICFKHGDIARKGSGRTAAAIVDTTSVTVVCGHVHREERATKTLRLRDKDHYVTVQTVGCTCRLDGAAPGSTGSDNWNQSLLLIDYDLAHDKFSMTNVPIEDGVAVWDEKIFKARDRMPDLAADLPGWNW